MEPYGYIWGDARAGGPEEKLLAAMAWQMVIDARAIAKRQASAFTDNPCTNRLTTGQRIMILEQAHREMKEWLHSPRFRFDMEMLGYDPDLAKNGIEEVMRGGKLQEITRFVRQHGSKKRRTGFRTRSGLSLPVRTVQQDGSAILSA